MAKLNGTETIGKQWMPEEEARSKGHDSIVIRWQEDEKYRNSSERSWMDRRILPILGSPHDDRHLQNRTLGTRGTGTKTPSRWYAMIVIAKLRKISHVFDKNKDGQNSCIPKNERVRQRPFDEALRADLEWERQNWKTFWSQTSS